MFFYLFIYIIQLCPDIQIDLKYNLQKHKNNADQHNRDLYLHRPKTVVLLKNTKK